ncbi:hypothetical protein [Cryptosporangium arvum]|uniref:hypothetical protein n=1 Tax=Cryptosporangium arvum TaxID=80871 RepID=UPI0004B29D3B|nr:hypothetical protein [Cryptosporangium arvum]
MQVLGIGGRQDGGELFPAVAGDHVTEANHIREISLSTASPAGPFGTGHGDRERFVEESTRVPTGGLQPSDPKHTNSAGSSAP